MERPKIGIIGIGYVGGAIRHWMESHPELHGGLFLYDKYKDIGSIDEVNKADIIFICVPTPYHVGGGGYDDSAVIESVNNIFAVPNFKKIVVIKSTILPGTTDWLQAARQDLNFIFNPEFLVARTANHDFMHPDRQIIGYTAKSINDVSIVLQVLPPATFVRTIPAKEAELVKYFGNAFLATKVIFANEFYDICKTLSANYELVAEAAGLDPRIGNSHLGIFHDGYRGYGGACFPKDINAFIDCLTGKGFYPSLLKKIRVINRRLRGLM